MRQFRYTKTISVILIVTATSVETDALHKHLISRDGSGKVQKHYKGNQTYYLGRIAQYEVVHVQCRMGSGTDGGSQVTVSEAIKVWKPKAAIMIGIAFGVDSEKQNIGDVLVSNNILPYESSRIGDDVIHRGGGLPSGIKLRNRFENARDWIHQTSEGYNCNVEVVDLLSGEKLIDQLEFRDKLLLQYPTAKGGEMEGAGFFIAARSASLEAIVVKAICDFADGNKGKDKIARQATAAGAAASLLAHVFANPTCLQDLGCAPIPEIPVSKRPLEQVLFSVYTPAVEKYYLERSIDPQIQAILANQNLWLWGHSGSAKTTLLLRNGSLGGRKPVFVDLSTSTGKTIKDTLIDAYWTLHDLLTPDAKSAITKIGANITSVSNAISNLIIAHTSESHFVIFDEYPGTSAADLLLFSEFAQTIILKITNSPISHSTRLCFASISKPFDSTAPQYEKLMQRVTPLEIHLWGDEDLTSLATKLTPELGLDLDQEALQALVSCSKGMPRRFKTILMQLCSRNRPPNVTLTEAIESLKAEFNYAE